MKFVQDSDSALTSLDPISALEHVTSATSQESSRRSCRWSLGLNEAYMEMIEMRVTR